MRVLLVYPPDHSLPVVPYASLPVLASTLRGAGHEVRLRDLNAEVFDWLDHESRLAAYIASAERDVEALEREPAPSAEQRIRRAALSRLLLVPRDAVLSAPQAARVLRSPESFYEPDAFARAIEDLQSMAHFVYGGNPAFDPENRFFMQQSLEALRHDLGDPVVDAYRAGLLEDLLACRPDVIGFSVTFHPQLFETLKLARLLRERAPGVPLVVGGAIITDFAREVFATPGLFDVVDYAIVGEGELALPLLLEALEGRRLLEQVPCLRWIEDGRPRVSTAPDAPVDLDTLPTPSYDGIRFELYLTPEPMVSLQSSKGCYYGRCAFCSEAFRVNARSRSADLFYADLKQIRETHGVRTFFVYDSLAPPRTLLRLAQSIAENGDDIAWLAETKFERAYLAPGVPEQLYRGGCRFLQLGLESASQRLLDLMDKGNELHRTDQIVDCMSRAGIAIGVTWFIGFPSETPAEALGTYEYLHSRRAQIQCSMYVGPFGLSRATSVYRDPERYGVRVFERDDGWPDWSPLDGSVRPELAELDQALAARSDRELMKYGWHLLYAVRAPERLRAITSWTRCGGMTQHVPGWEQRPLRLSAGAILHRSNGLLAPLRLASHRKTHQVAELEQLQQAILDRADGSLAAVGLSAVLGAWEGRQVLAEVRRLVDWDLLCFADGAHDS